MSLYGSSVEYGLHCLLYLVFPKEDFLPSSKDMAEFQGISPSYVAKLFTQLQKAGIVQSVEGIKGGFELKRPAKEISVLDVADALEGKKPLFQCKDIRHGCVLHKGSPPIWAPLVSAAFMRSCLKANSACARRSPATAWLISPSVPAKKFHALLWKNPSLGLRPNNLIDNQQNNFGR
jgi:Rrf2 family protein